MRSPRFTVQQFKHAGGWLSLAPLMLTAVLVVSQPGCVGLAAHLMYFAFGNLKPADFEGLEDRRVAVLCVADASPVGDGTVSDMLARRVGILLAKNVKKIEVVPNSEVANWRDQNGDPLDYREVGKGVNAESLVVIELSSYSLQPSGTLYRGQAVVSITVYDMNKKGNVVWENLNSDFSFPSTGGIASTELSRNAFQQRVLTAMAQEIAKHFYAYDFEDDFGADTRSLH